MDFISLIRLTSMGYRQKKGVLNINLKESIMKSTRTLAFICLLGVLNACQAQEKKETVKAKQQETNESNDTIKQMNLIDEQVKMYGSIFDLAGAGNDNPVGDASNYTELINEMDLPKEQKKELIEIYGLYELSLDPKKKKEFEIKLNKKLEEGMRNATIEN